MNRVVPDQPALTRGSADSTMVAPSSPPSTRTVEKAERVLSTLNSDGSRRWLKPRPSPGRFLRARRIVAAALIAIFTVLPYLRIGDKPAILLDLTTRHFTILGVTFLPTDTVLLALLLVGIFVTIFLMTALLGRVWCGWACPQTVYMEFIFRPIERLFEGAPGRKTRDGFRGSGAAKVLKHLSFLLVSFYLAHTFLAYFVPVETLSHWVTGSPFNHPAGFLIVAAVTALMMFDFGYFREQVCILACPYGRFQSALLDRHSLIVSYDERRGEPRGKMQHAATASDRTNGVALPVIGRTTAGDCVDCGMCVTTCPTGIDIRDGLQMECIGCAQCIDACNAVMDKVDRPRGLIRYSSQAAMALEKTSLMRPRVIIYPLILSIIAALFAFTLLTRNAADVTVLRGLGRPFVEMPSGEIGNQVRVKIVNRTDTAARFTISVEPAEMKVQAEDNPATVEPGTSRTIPAFIVTPPDMFSGGRCHVTVIVSNSDGFSDRTEWELLGPGSHNAPSQRSSDTLGAHDE